MQWDGKGSRPNLVPRLFSAFKMMVREGLEKSMPRVKNVGHSDWLKMAAGLRGYLYGHVICCLPASLAVILNENAGPGNERAPGMKF